jgi:ABC-type phosphate transport system substrate-binding protein/transcriptional regulator with XRE-family HTH domain
VPGRPVTPLPKDAPEALADLAEGLRELREAARLTLAQLAEKSCCSQAALSQAASGKRLPTWEITKAYVQGCGGDLDGWHSLWLRASSATSGRLAGASRQTGGERQDLLPGAGAHAQPAPGSACEDAGRTPWLNRVPWRPRRLRAFGKEPRPAASPISDPVLVSTTSEFVNALQLLRFHARDPSFHEMSQRARKAGADVPASTLRDACSVHSRLPAPQTVRAFLTACGVIAQKDQEAWDDAWKRARWAESHARDVHAQGDAYAHKHSTMRRWATPMMVILLIALSIGSVKPALVPAPANLLWVPGSGQATATCEAGHLDLAGSTAFARVATPLADGLQSTCFGELINVTADGSCEGVQALVRTGSQHAASFIAMSDGLAPCATPDLVSSPVAIIIFSMVVNKDVGIYNLSTTDIRDIYAGRIINWGQLGGPNLPIKVISRNPASGTRTTFQNWVLGGTTPSSCLENDPVPRFPFYRCEPTTASLLDMVSQTPGAIGYAEIAAASSHDGIIQTAIDGVQPMIYSVAGADGYPFWTVEHLYTYGQPPDQSPAAGFLRYLNTPQAKAVLRLDGFTPCSDQAQFLADLCTER